MGSNPPRYSSLEEELAALRARASGLGEADVPRYAPPRRRPPAAAPEDTGLLDEALARLRGTQGPDLFGQEWTPPNPAEEAPDLDALNAEFETQVRSGAEHVRSTQGDDAVEPYVYAQHSNRYGKRIADILKAGRDHGLKRVREGASVDEAEDEARNLAGQHISTLEQRLMNGEQERAAEEYGAAYEGLVQSLMTPRGLARTALTTGVPMVVGLGVSAIPGAGPILAGGAVAGTTTLAEAAAQRFIDERPEVDWRDAAAAGVTNILEVPVLKGARAAAGGIANPLLRRAAGTALTAGAEAAEEATQLVGQTLLTDAELPSAPALLAEAAAGAVVGGALGGTFSEQEQAREQVVDEMAAATAAAADTTPPRPAAEVPNASIDSQVSEMDAALEAARTAGDISAVEALEQARQTALDLKQQAAAAPKAAEPPQPGMAGPVTVAPAAPVTPPAPTGAAAAVTPVLPGAPPGPGAGVTVTPPITPGAPPASAAAAAGELSPVQQAQARAAAARPTVQALTQAGQATAAGLPGGEIAAATTPVVGTAPPELGIIGGQGPAPVPQTTPAMPSPAAALPPAALPAPGATVLPFPAPAVAPAAAGRIALPQGDLVQGPDGWALDVAGTPEAESAMQAFETTVIPLPLTPEVSPEEAAEFVRSLKVATREMPAVEPTPAPASSPLDEERRFVKQTLTPEEIAEYVRRNPTPKAEDLKVGDTVYTKSGREGVVRSLTEGGGPATVETKDYRGRKRKEVVPDYNLTKTAPAPAPEPSEEEIRTASDKRRAEALTIAAGYLEDLRAAKTDQERQSRADIFEGELYRANVLKADPERIKALRAEGMKVAPREMEVSRSELGAAQPKEKPLSAKERAGIKKLLKETADGYVEPGVDFGAFKPGDKVQVGTKKATIKRLWSVTDKDSRQTKAVWKYKGEPVLVADVLWDDGHSQNIRLDRIATGESEGKSPKSEAAPRRPKGEKPTSKQQPSAKKHRLPEAEERGWTLVRAAQDSLGERVWELERDGQKITLRKEPKGWAVQLPISNVSRRFATIPAALDAVDTDLKKAAKQERAKIKPPKRPSIKDRGEAFQKAANAALDRFPDGERAAARKTVEEQMWRRFLVGERESDHDYFGNKVDQATGQKIVNRAVKRRAAKDALANARTLYEAGWETLRAIATTEDAKLAVKRLRLLVEGKGLPTGASARVELPLTSYTYAGVQGWVEHEAALPLGEAVEKVKSYAKAYPQAETDVMDSLQRLAAEIDSLSEQQIRVTVDLPGAGRAAIKKALAKGPDDPLFKRMVEYRRNAQAEQRAFDELMQEYADQPFEHPPLLQVAKNLEEDGETGPDPLLKTFMWGIEDPETGKQATVEAAVQAIRDGSGRLFARIRTAYTDAMSVMANDVPFDIPAGGPEEGILEAARDKEGQGLIPGFMEAAAGTKQKPVARQGKPAPDFADSPLFTQDEAKAARELEEREKKAQGGLFDDEILSAPQDPFDGRYGPPPKNPTAEQLAARNRWASILGGGRRGLPAPSTAAAPEGGTTATAGGPAAGGEGAAVGEGTAGSSGRGRRGHGVPAGVQGAPGGAREGAPVAARQGIFLIVNPREAETLERPAKTDLIPARLRDKLSEEQTVGVAKAIEALQAGSGFLFEDGTGVGKTRELLATADTFARAGAPVLIISKASAIEPKKVGDKWVPSGSYRDDSAAMDIPITFVKDRSKPLKPGVVHLGTYHQLRDYAVTGDTVLMFDEAHQLKNAGDSEVAAAGADLIRRAKVTAFATATPGDKPYHMSYLAPIGFFEGRDPVEALKDLGVKVSQRKRVSKALLKKALATGMPLAQARLEATETIDVWKTTSPAKMRKAIEALFRRLTRSGTVVKREVDLSPIQVITHKVKLPPEAHEILKRIEEGNFDRKNALMHMRRQQEPFKVEDVKRLVMTELTEGRQVVVFAARVNQSEVVEKIGKDPRTGDVLTRVIAESEGTLKELGAWLRADNIPFSEIHGAAEEISELAQERFQRGEAKVVIATYEKGGTGINLDDRSGAAPRSMILMTAPFDSVSIVQAIGRVHRFTTRSPSRIHILFSDHGIDAWNGAVLMGKLKHLHAMVSGDIVALDLTGLGGDEEALNMGAVHYGDAARILTKYGPAGGEGILRSAKHWRSLVDSLKRMGVKIKARDGGEFEIQTHEGFALEGKIEKTPQSVYYGAIRWNHDQSAEEFRGSETYRREEAQALRPTLQQGLSLMSEIGPYSGKQRDVKRVVSKQQYEFLRRRLDEVGAVWGNTETAPGSWQVETREGHFLVGELLQPRNMERTTTIPPQDHGAFYWIRVDNNETQSADVEENANASIEKRAEKPEPSSDPSQEPRGVTGIVGTPAKQVIYVRPHLDWRKPARLGTGVALVPGQELAGVRGVKVASAAMREGFAKIGRIDFDGQYVGTLENAAAVFQTARNPSLEHAAVLFIDNAGVVRGSMQASAQAPTYVGWGPHSVFLGKIQEKLRAFAAQGVDIQGVVSLHNHPSGNHTPSDADVKHSNGLAKALRAKYWGAAVIDHEQATIIRPSGSTYRIARAAQRYADPDPYLQQGVDAAAYHTPQSPFKVRNPSELRGLGEAVLGSGWWRDDSRDVSVMFVDRQSRATLVTMVPRPLFNSKPSFERFVKLMGKVAGASSAFAASPGILADPLASSAAEAHIQSGLLQDVLDLGTPDSLGTTMLNAGTYHGHPEIPWRTLNSRTFGVGDRLEAPAVTEPPVSAVPDWNKPDPDWWTRRLQFAQARSRARLSQANVGVDPRAFWDAVVMGVDLVRKGVRSFSAWLKKLVSDIPWLGRYARQVWEYIAGLPGAPTVTVVEGTPLPFEQAVERTGMNVPAYKGPIRPIPKVTTNDMLKVAEAIAQGGPVDVGGGKPIGIDKPRDFPINIHQVSDEGHVKETIARGARALYDRLAAARQKYTMPQLHAMALDLGYSESDWQRMVREKGALTAPEIIFGRVLRQEAGLDFNNKWALLGEARELAKEKGLSEAERTVREQAVLDAELSMNAALQKFVGLMYGTAAAGAEAGRALRAHGLMVQSLTPSERFLHRLARGKRADEKLLAQLAEALQKNDMERAGELMRKIERPGLLRMLVEYYINSLLSAPSTPIANVAGNFVHEVSRTAERALAARLEQIGLRQGLERLLRGEAKPTERVVGEATQALKAQVRHRFGLLTGLKLAKLAITREDIRFMRSLKGEVYPPAIPGAPGKVVRAPGRVMEALDLAARQSAMAAEQSALLWRRVYEEAHKNSWSLKSDDFKARLTELHDQMNRWVLLEEQRRIDPAAFRAEHGVEGYKFLYKHRDLARVYQQMEDAGDVATFRDQTTRFTSFVKAMRHTYPALSFVTPFVHTTERLLIQGFRRSPLGLIKTVYNIQQGTIEGGEASDRLAQGILGTMLTAAIYMLAKDGLITGGAPEDPRERDSWLKTGKQPYAVKVGNTWYSYARIEPLATTMGLAADLASATDEKVAGDIFNKLHYSVINTVTNKTYLEGLINAAEALGDPDRHGGRFWKRMIGAAVPNLLAAAARAIDPTIRQTDTLEQTLMSRIPVLSERLPARFTGTGEDVVRGETALSRFASPIRYSEEAGPERNLERLFLEAGYHPSQPPREITIPGTMGRKVTLNQNERRIYAEYSKRATTFARELAQNGDWSALDPAAKQEVLERIYRFAHDAARREMLRSVTQRLAAGTAEVVTR